METAASPTVAALVRDLLFASRITSAARAAGIEVRIVRDPAMLKDSADRLLLADLGLPGAIEAAAEWRRRTAGRVVGFAAHVDVEGIARARTAGLDRVMSRGGFAEALPGLLRELTAATDGPADGGATS